MTALQKMSRNHQSYYISCGGNEYLGIKFHGSLIYTIVVKLFFHSKCQENVNVLVAVDEKSIAYIWEPLMSEPN